MMLSTCSPQDRKKEEGDEPSGAGLWEDATRSLVWERLLCVYKMLDIFDWDREKRWQETPRRGL